MREFIISRSKKEIFFSIVNTLLIYFFRLVKVKLVKKKIFNFKMNLMVNDNGLSKELIKYKERELDQKYIIDKELHSNMNVYDLGSNLGYYSLIILNKINPTKKLIAVEPVKQNYEICKKNIMLNKFNNYEIYNFGISNEAGFQKFYKSEKSNLGSFEKKNIKNSNLTTTQQFKTYSLEDLFLISKTFPDFIRMDVEGHEVKILNSLQKLLTHKLHYPKILFEVHINKYDVIDNNLSNSLQPLFLAGYKAKIISSSKISGTEIIENLGYKKKKLIKTDGVTRAIFENISNNDLINLCTNTGGIRAVLLEKY